MITICFDTCYNKCTIPFADANLFMNDALTSQMVGMVWQQNLKSAYETGTYPYVDMENKKTKQT